MQAHTAALGKLARAAAKTLWSRPSYGIRQPTGEGPWAETKHSSHCRGRGGTVHSVKLSLLTDQYRFPTLKVDATIAPKRTSKSAFS